MKKNIVILLLVVMVMLSAMAGRAQKETCSLSDFLAGFTRDLYENKDIGTTHDFSHYIEGEALAAYLAEKVAINQLVTNKARLDKVNYRVDTTLKSVEALDSETYFVTLAIRINFNYVCMEDTNSGYGEIMHLIVANNNGRFKVLDLYVPYNYYDIEVRGKVDFQDIYTKNPGLQIPEESEIIEKARLLRKRLEAYYN